MNPFLGTWVGPDEYTSEVEYTVREVFGRVIVDAVDPSDGEADVKLSSGELTFTVVWPSTGRVARCRLECVSEIEVCLTFTFTDHARLVRKHA